jgi:hypothetical protein
MEIEGERTMRFSLIRTTVDGEQVHGTDALLEADETSVISAWLSAHRRGDWSYRVWDRRKKLTLTEFATL